MAKITSKYLLECGFERDNALLPKYRLGDGKEFLICVTTMYFACSNELGYSVMAWKTGKSGTISKRIQASVFTEIEELRKCLEVVGLDEEIWG